LDIPILTEVDGTLPAEGGKPASANLGRASQYRFNDSCDALPNMGRGKIRVC
jgi:hypothetical protein